MPRPKDMPTHLQAQRLEDCTFLADQGETMEVAAKRLGITEVALDKWLNVHDKPLRARLIANGNQRPGTGAVRSGHLTMRWD